MLAPQTFTRRFFRDFFPPPRFLEMPAVGLDISDTAITALELVRRGDAFTVGRFGRRLLPAGAIADGYVHDKEKVTAELNALKKELRLNFVNGSLPEEKAYLYTVKLPQVSSKEMRAAIEFTLEENVPLSPAEAIFDYTVIQNASSSPADSQEVSVTALPRAVVHAYAEIFHGAGLVPLSFELRAQAICRAVIARGDRGTYLVVHQGAEKTGLFVVRNKTVYFTATAAAEDTAREDELSPSFAASDSRSRIGEDEERNARRADISPAPLFLSPTASIARLHAEIGKVISYWRTHAGDSGETIAAIGKIVLCGRGAAAPQFRESLSRALALPVLVANVWSNVFSFDAYIPQILFKESLDYAAAVGLALPKDH